MEIKNTPHAGWQNNLQLVNQKAELLISLDVGPRILSYRTPGGTNVLKNYPDQMGTSGEPTWMIRGGHRLWIAPEDETLSYVPDNQPVQHTLLPANTVHLVNAPVAPWSIRKEMFVTLSEETSQVTIRHRATNEGTAPIEIATWGLTVMVPGGLEIIPLPPLGEHPRNLLPNRLMMLWPYTDMSDPRFRFGWRFITIRQAGDGRPLKLGLAHKEKWVAYLTKDALFIKTIEYVEGATYPDGGCNFETFTNQEMLEVESLSPLRRLAPGEAVEHTEHWFLFGGISMPHSLKEQELADWIQPRLKEIGVL